MKKERNKLIGCVLFLIFAFVIFGKEKVNIILMSAIWTIQLVISSLNFISVTFNDGNGILTLLFSYPITYIIVGIIFCIWPIRGKIGSLFGKICYYLCSIPISAVLNLISAKLF